MKTLLVILLCLFPFSAWAACTGTANYDIVTCDAAYNPTGGACCRAPKTLSYADVSAAITDSATGDGSVYLDGVYLPAGTSPSYGDFLTLKVGMVLKGAGSSSTHIHNGVVALANKSRVTGIDFVADAGAWTAHVRGLAIVSNFRIDHNIINDSSYGIWFQHTATGVIDSNTFNVGTLQTENPSCVLYADPDSTWSAIDFGQSTGWVYVENNTFNFSAVNPDCLETMASAKMVVRYNTMNETGSGSIGAIAEAHNDVTAPAPTGKSGGRGFEVYNNLINLSTSGGPARRFVNLRSGTALIYSNVLDYSALGSMPGTNMTLRSYRAAGGENHDTLGEEDCANFSTNTSNAWYSGTLTAKCCSTSYSTSVDGHTVTGEGYPCLGAPGQGVYGGTREPVYFWNNRSFDGGSTYTQVDSTIVGVAHATEQWAIVANTDYCTATSKPASCGGVTLTYSPYTCPHPLTGLGANCSASVAGTAGYNPIGGPPPPVSGGLCINCQVIQ